MIQVSVIIVNYNTKEITNNCIESIKKFTKDIAYEIILVDNASEDGSAEFFPNIKDLIFIKSPENLGFGRANNLGADYARGEFLFLLNSDTILIENSIKILYDSYVENFKDLKIGVLGAVLIDTNRQIIHSGDNFNKPFEQFHYYYRKLFKISQKNLSLDFKNNFYKIELVTGADMFLNKELFFKADKFYDKFFMYFEETDLQKRIANLGYLNYLTNKTQIIHLEGASFNQKVAISKRIITQRSKNLYYKRNFKKTYPFYVSFDFLFNFVRMFNFNYKLKENLKFVLENIKSY
ncbi:glycosyltransferase family 2 protein [Elizabethkingia anophelis]|uniref:glycosyltransferase family 2 protein n=1 Tax=Elizabethkingia anophelis TaxID=1117645 RepID=UPI000B34B150|nr:glycosyltransferase family 2 protein [Elizabethkingia anophelis]MCT3700308.1 glycosyltransferase family 2 protein [Elizabethkingia anophelis]MCT3898477.1 glycosyltransferase family 2 protein [Elizabethkingia anophelis]MCT4326765.1 glycosyltransferase family 2 protein [Elizabethkingia anophelis]MDV3550395.1 glycosyltransferase family 2 protein [Elizabethkingia anophelis]MDV3564592.1 glycosyltransferase family 2 protein [Elizabethkingia anophelis]